MRFLAAFAFATLLAAPAFAGFPLRPPVTQPQRVAPVPAIPEPAALALFVLGAGVVGVAIRRRKG
jgi:hypothetical protein